MKRAARTLGVLCALALVGWGYVWFYGSAIVYDYTDRVDTAVITNGETEWSLYRLPGGLFFRIVPRGDGEIEVRCRDGSSYRNGYVTHHSHTWVRMIADGPCRFAEGT